ncbi:MAG: S24/S26 family peptidase [Coriobacteriia bacterium]
MRPVLQTLGWVLVGAVAVACVLFCRIAIASGGSMEPALVGGDVCLAATSLHPREGDIVLYARPGDSPVLHRVVALDSSGNLRTAGDANEHMDQDPVPPQCVKGRVVFVFPLGRAVRNWMRCVRGATLLTQSS